MNRRQYLLVAGGVATAAGCTSTDAETSPSESPTAVAIEDREPARIELVSIESPDFARMFEDVQITITVRNTGGRTGEIYEYLRGPRGYNERIQRRVEPGQTTTIEKLVDYGGWPPGNVEFTFADRPTYVTYEPAERVAGEWYESSYGLALRITDAQAAQRVTYENTWGNDEEEVASEDRQLLILLVEQENRGREPVYSAYPSDFFCHADGNELTTEATFDTMAGPMEVELKDPVRGQTIGHRELNPGEGFEGWTVLETYDRYASPEMRIRFDSNDAADVVYFEI